MARAVAEPDNSPYERDLYSWTREQAAKLRARAHNEIDWENLAEEVESVGRSEKNQLRSRLGVLLKHLLKWDFQPQRRSHSWQSTISEQRVHISGILRTSPSLKRSPGQMLEAEYRWARRDASRETQLPLAVFPVDCPYSVRAILDADCMPGPPWKPDDLIRD